MSATTEAFRVFTEEIPVNTGGELDIVDISEDVRRTVDRSGVFSGLASVFVAGQTAAVTTIECEPGAVADLRGAIERLAPRDITYEHDARWGDGNGRSHVRAAVLGPDLTLPVRNGSLLAGTWQQIVLVELDLRRRERRVHITVSGAVRSGEDGT